MRRSIITGTGSCIPPQRIRNEDLVSRRFYTDYDKPLDPAGNADVVQKFHKITNIAERRYVEDGVVASDIGLIAAERALEDSGFDKESLDYIIVAHNFGDIRSDNRRSDFVPTLAARIKQRLEIANPHCVAYDLPFGCPGWLQGVIQSDYFLRSGDASRALVIGSETLSRVCDPHDRDSMLYADGAGATVFEARELEEQGGIIAHATRSDTLKHAQMLWMGTSYNPQETSGELYLKMNGRKLYEYALTTVPGVVKDCLDRAGATLSDVRKLLIHQANHKMDEAILERLFRAYAVEEIPDGIMPMTIEWLGNSSVATLPTLLDLISRGKLEDHQLDSGDLVVFASVGAGMNINAVVYRCV
ncbi:ketoacyl-ACP synthase III [bacterium]|nr:MAG: ketoacyl-ACP synthase III [bacterium]RKZ17225.1 MAG: ketoacyl-ACP synthase III [bacterium]